jgi:phospholipase A1/A2
MSTRRVIYWTSRLGGPLIASKDSTMRSLGQLFLAICLAVAAPAHAEWILKSNATRVEPGQPFELDLILLNDSSSAMDATLPDRLPVRVTAGTREFTAELRLAKPPSVPAEPLPPGAFRRTAYTLTLPPDVEGSVVIALTGVQASPLTLIAARAAPIGGPEVAAAKPPAPPASDPRQVDTQPVPALQTHEPMYLIFGRRHDETTAKFQLSFKYRILDERSFVADWLPPLAKLHFGYTQTSLWNLSQDSKPFEDTSYRPSFFYLEPAVWTSSDGRHNISFEGGFEHESNGQGGDQSRSINTLYIRPAWRFFLDDRHYFIVSPKIWHYLQDYETFQIERYRGYGELNLRVGRRDGLQLSTSYRKGTSTMGAVQVDLTYPIRRPFFANAGGYLMFQYFNGYGETLLNYDVKGPAQFRFGFAIVR